MPFLNLDTDRFHLRKGGNKILVLWYEQVDWALIGGSVAEPLECWTCNSEAPRFGPFGILNPVMFDYILIICFSHLLSPTSISAINTPEGKQRNYYYYYYYYCTY